MRTVPPPRPAVGLLLALAVVTGAPRPVHPAEPLGVSLAAAAFPSADSGAEIHLYLSIPLAPLSVDSASFQVRLKIEPGPEDSPLGGAWVYPSVPVRARGGEAPVFRHVYVYRMAPGGGKARVWVQELESDRSGEAVADLDVPDYQEPGLHVSDPVLGTRVRVEGSPDPVVPLPGREFGGERDTVTAFLRIRDDRAEDPSPSYRLHTEIRGRRGLRRELELDVPRRDRSGEVVIEQGVTGFPPGDYRMTIEVRLGETAASSDGWFRVGESGSTLGTDPDRLRTVLGYVATHREKILLEDAPDDSLEVIWKAFWNRRDPTPGTRRNESEEEFLSRVDQADRRFGGLDPGWKTDMGRIFIRYGPPDRVERYQGEPGRFPAEIWTYTARGERFVFQDEGFGRYRLALGR